MRVRPFAVAVLLVLPGALAACGDEGSSTKAGDIVQARIDDQFEDGKDATVTLPTGRLLIHSTDPVESASPDETRTREQVDAPAGAVLVPITWQYDTWASDRLDGIMAPATTPIIDLVSGDQRYRLPPPRREKQEGESFYVVVEGDGAERSLEIDFDGVTQTVDLALGKRDKGEAAGLYDIEDARLKKDSCDNKQWFDEDRATAEFTCDLIGPVLTPYAGGKWAPDGSLWLAMTILIDLRAYGDSNGLGGTAFYRARSVRVTAEVSGDDPIYELSTETAEDNCPTRVEQTCGWAKHLIFQVPADDPEKGPLKLEVKYKLNLVNAWGDWSPRERKADKASESFKLWEEEKDEKDGKKKRKKKD